MNVHLPCRRLTLSLALAAALTHSFADGPPPESLWPGPPPQALANPPAEAVVANGHIQNVSAPSMTAYLPTKEESPSLALIVCPGGAYRQLDWPTHVLDTAQYFNPRGVAVIGLKYRTCPPYKITKDDRSIPLSDLKRAMRLARAHAAEWNIDPHRVGVLGFSAGANLAMTLASQFDGGDPNSPDPVERFSSRPDFVIGCATWHWREKASPFAFTKEAPPIFLVHATNDGQPGKNGGIVGAPIELPQAIEGQLKSLGVPVHLEIYAVGGHGAGALVPQLVARNFPPTQWPDRFQAWLAGPEVHLGAPARKP